MFIGVSFLSSDATTKGREQEKLADGEIFDTACAVKSALEARGHQVELVNLNSTGIEQLRKYEWVFNLAEAICGFPFAEYEIAKSMEELRIHFTGSGSSALIDCLDKAFTKSRLRRARIITPAYEIYHPNDIINTKLKFPLIAKPIHEDGSVGISDDSISKNVAELAGTVKKIHEIYEQAALVEEYIEGRDITASVIGNGEEVTVLPLSESVFYKHDGPTLLTFEANWVPESKAYQNSVSKCPCELDYEVELRIKDFAKKAYKIMRCRDYARIDFRLRDKTPYVLEVNPNPCINPIGSGFVTSGEASGLSYDELINKILENSVKSRNLVAEPFSFGDMYGNYSQRSHKKRQTHYRNDIIQNKNIPYRR